MKTIKDEIKLIYDSIRNKGGWYIDLYAPDEYIDIAEKAKSEADKKLSNISYNSLYKKYLKWATEDNIHPQDADYYYTFLNDLIFEFGLKKLKGKERDLFKELIVLTIKFI